MNTSVSIFVIAYNMEKYIEKCVSSLLKQSYDNYKIVLIENGSNKDHTREIIEDYANRYDKVEKILIDHNQQYGNALELAIKNCDSDYFIICDPDDYLEEDALEKLVKRSEEADLVCGSRNVFYEDSDEVDYDSCINEEITTIRNETILSHDLKYDDLFFLNPTPHSKLYKTKKVKDIIIPKETFTDNVLYFKALMEADKVIYDNTLNVSNYLINRSGNSTTTYKPTYISAFNTMTKGLIETCKKGKNYSTLKGIFSLRLYLSLKDMINLLHSIKGSKEEILQNMMELYDTIIPVVLENKKMLGAYEKYYKLDRYDHFLLNTILGKMVYKRSIKRIIEE